jgi:hypothetical protein
MGRGRKGGGDAVSGRHYSDGRWVALKASILAGEGKRGRRGGSGAAVSGEEGKRRGGSMCGAGGMAARRRRGG